MIYIIEGIDHTGKTTIIKELMRVNPGIVIHSGTPEKRPIINRPPFVHSQCNGRTPNNIMAYNQLIYFFSGCKMLKRIGNGINIYLDRFHLGEYVYFKYRPDETEQFDRTTVFQMADEMLCADDRPKNEYVFGPECTKLDIKLVLLTFSENGLATVRPADKGNSYCEAAVLYDQEDFLKAFEMSNIEQKTIIQVDNEGQWRSRHDILDDILCNSIK